MKEPNENINNNVGHDVMYERKIYRRKRRIRNQILVYITSVILLAGIVAGANFGLQTISQILKDYQAANAQAHEPVLEVEDVTDPEPEVIEYIAPPEEEAVFIEEEPPVVVTALDILVDDYIAAMPLEDKIAQLFILTPEALTGAASVTRAGNTTRDKLNEYPVGGLIYFAGNIQSASQVREMLSNTSEMSKYPLFLAIDEEGGSVTRLAGRNIAENVGPMENIGATGDPQNAYAAGNIIGTYMSDFGFNLNFAPVADVFTDSENNPMGSRTFSDDPAIVAEMVRAFVGGMKDTGIYSTLKHFPGLGFTTVDTHVGMAVTERTLDEMRDFEFMPFAAGIDAGVEFVMLGHVSAPNVTGDNTPASISRKIITEILRDELGFKGIIVTDAMNMGAIIEYYTAAEAAVKALQAGADMILMPESFEEAYIGVLEAIENGRINEERINESLRRIFRVKLSGLVEE